MHLISSHEQYLVTGNKSYDNGTTIAEGLTIYSNKTHKHGNSGVLKNHANRIDHFHAS